MFPPLKGTCIGIYDYTTSPYNVTGGITNVNKPSSFYIRDDFFVLWDKDVHKRHYPIKQKFQDYFRSKKYTRIKTGGKLLCTRKLIRT